MESKEKPTSEANLPQVKSPRSRDSNADMVELEAKAGREKRRFARIRPAIHVDLANVSDIKGFVNSYVHDISLGGMFVKTSQPRPIGTHVSFRMYFDVERGGCEFEGTVVRTVTLMEAADSPDPDVVPGMAIEFEELSPDAQGLLHHVVRDYHEPRSGGVIDPI